MRNALTDPKGDQRSPYEVVLALATDLRRAHGSRDLLGRLSDATSFTHVPIAATLDELLDRLKRSPAGPLLVPEGEPLTAAGTTRWNGEPLPQVICHYGRLVGAHATASVWKRPRWPLDGAELMLSLDFGLPDPDGSEAGSTSDDKVATLELTMNAPKEGEPWLARSVIDHRRDDVDQGYEGESRTAITPNISDVLTFVELVSGVVPSERPHPRGWLRRVLER